MNTSSIDYHALYKIQDRVISALSDLLDGFYLTGGTALDRFYLHHRYSEDLDFFINDSDEYSAKVNAIYRKLKDSFSLDEALTLQTDTYTRFYLAEPDKLKIDIVNDVPEHWGALNYAMSIQIDNPANILSNKLGTIVSRDEPKDLFDIIILSETYSFNWKEVFLQTKRKQIINETDIAMRISSFPVKLMMHRTWSKVPINSDDIETKLNTIADDFIFARDNSLGRGKAQIETARIRFKSKKAKY